MTAPTIARTAAEKAALIDRLIPAVAAGIRAEDDLSLRHEIERYEALAPSPLVLRMRAIVRAEEQRRAVKAVA